jgi:DNA modification methylase
VARCRLTRETHMTSRERATACNLVRPAVPMMGFPPAIRPTRWKWGDLNPQGNVEPASLKGRVGPATLLVVETNVLYYGDNLDVLRRHVKDESVDLVYLDPPFNSNANYNVLFAEHGEKAAAQVQAFTDTWEWNTEARGAYEEVVEAGGPVAEALRAFRTLIPASDMLAYLSMMAPRLVELHRVLKPTGWLYLHCDPTASHYLKLLLDAVFVPKSFTNEVVWKRYGAHNDAGQGSRHFGRVHDILLTYAKGSTPIWNQLFTTLDPTYVEQTYRNIEPGTGRRFATTPMTGPGGAAKGNPVFEWKGHTRAWRYSRETIERLDTEGRLHYSGTGYVRQKLYLDESKGVPVQDTWTDIPSLSGAHKERLGYPTQKPLALLRRIIDASTNPGDVVLDPFCGCGTTIDAAQESPERRWIGIDITHLSIGLIKHRLVDRYGPEIAKTYRVIGEPTTVDDARVLAKEDKLQFQAWALGLVGARLANSDKPGGDKGIDGRLYFHEGGSETRQIVFSVKGGEHLVPNFVRDLRGVIEREGAEIGVLLSFEAPTAGMRSEAAEAGFYESPWGKHPRIQLRTVGELLAGQGVDYPHVTGANVTHRRAQRAKTDEAEALPLFGGQDDTTPEG